MKSIDDNTKNNIKTEIKIEIDPIWLSHQAMMIGYSNTKNNKFNLTIDNVIERLNSGYDEVIETEAAESESEIPEVTHNFASYDIAQDFISNLNYKNRELIGFEIPDEWFQNHLLMSHVYNPKKSLAEHANYIVEQLKQGHLNTKVYSPELDEFNTIFDTFMEASSNIFSSFENTPMYKKFEKSLLKNPA